MNLQFTDEIFEKYLTLNKMRKKRKQNIRKAMITSKTMQNAAKRMFICIRMKLKYKRFFFGLIKK